MDSDQIDGGKLSSGKKKGVRVSGKDTASSKWNRRKNDLPIVQTDFSAPSPSVNSTIISIGPHHWPTALTESHPEDHTSTVEENRLVQPYIQSPDSAVSKQMVKEVKSLLKERSILKTRKNDEDKFVHHCHIPGWRIACKPDDIPSTSFTTFKPTLGSYSRSRDDKKNPYREFPGSQKSIAELEHIKRQISHDNIGLVRFEATNLHGISISKTVPASLFHEKAVYGVPMPRSYLELMLSPKENEVDHPVAQSFNSNILLIPDLSTFRALPWAEQTARIICDPCTITGIPLRTSPRLIAKLMLSQLNTMGFSIHSSFTYECCIFRVPERMDSKIIFFPATTLSNHDMPFLQQLVRGMYHMGINVDSFASASGPGQMEFCFKPKFGIEAADGAFTFRTGVKEMARKYNYIATFLTDDAIYNSVCLSHSLWDADGRDNLFHSGAGEMTEVGQKWLAGLLQHSPALSCLMEPGLGCRTHLSKNNKSTVNVTCGFNDNSCTFNVKFHGGQEMHIDNKLGSAIANPYIVMAATIAAGLDGIKSNLCAEQCRNRPPAQQTYFAIPVKLEDALVALEEDSVIHGALGEAFVQYFIAMKRLEIETQESDLDRNKNLEYFI